ncbi:MAG: site-specific DNA-methyltransferase, partial [Dehalococcoidia bacterium]
MAIPKKHTRRRRATKTSSFGTNGRESHDASAYYSRALQPDESLIKGEPGDEQPLPSDALNQVFVHSSERMYELPDRSVHLMVTSPPYNVGKDYDQDLTLKEYTSLLQRVLTETFRVLVPGGRACVNIANLGRKPYIPLHSDVIEASVASGFFMRGEIIWNKSAGAGSSTAWGSWCSPSNPTLRDVHEYILVFQKPPFRRENPHKRIATITRDEFL